MKITLTGKQVDISDRLRNRVEEAVENAVNKYFNAPISCSVAFSKDGEDWRRGEMYSCGKFLHCES